MLRCQTSLICHQKRILFWFGTDCSQTYLISEIVIDLANKIIGFIIAIHNYLEGLNDTHLNAFLADSPSANCKTRSVLLHSLPILSWMPEAFKAAGKDTAGIVKLLTALANHIAWGQTYSAIE